MSAPPLPSVGEEIRTLDDDARRRFVREARRRATETALSSPLHGPRHWRDVLEMGCALIAEGVPADRDVLLAFAALHDTQRENDFKDPEHGSRAADVATDLRRDCFLDWLSPEGFGLLVRACEIHTEADGSHEPTIAACLDADRLTLWRVGKDPDLAFLSADRWLSVSVVRQLVRYARYRTLADRNRSWKRILRD